MLTTMEEISTRIRCGEYTLVEETKPKKSAMWNNFRRVCDGNDERIENCVACVHCKKAYQFSNNKTGTSNLLKHKCPASFEVVLTHSQENENNLTTRLMQTVTRKVVEFVTKDVRPVDVIAGEGFMDLAQTFVEIGEKHGFVDVREVMPQTATLTRISRQMAADVRMTVSVEVKQVLNSMGGAISLEFWKDGSRNIAYVGVNVHYVRDFFFQQRTLGTVDYIEGSSESVATAIVQVLERFDIEECVEKMVLVTDTSSDLTCELNTRASLFCSVRGLNNVLDQIMTSVNGAFVVQLIDSCRALVDYFERADLQVRLQVPLKYDLEGNWQGKLDMFNSIASQGGRICEILEQNDLMLLIDCINNDVLEAVISFLKPFMEAVSQLNASLQPTLYLVFLWYRKLSTFLITSHSDSAVLLALKESAMKFLQNELKLNILHKVAIFLHPLLKNMKIIDVEDKDFVLAETRQLLTAMDCKEFSRLASDHSLLYQPLQKKPRLEPNIVLDFIDSSDGEELELDEISRYAASKVKSEENFDILAWWKVHGLDYPSLAKVAQFVHSIPASCVPTLSHVEQNCRSSLEAAVVDDVLFLHSNLRIHHFVNSSYI